MRDPRITKLADVLVNYSTKVRAGEFVGIASDPLAMPLIEALTEAILKAGGNPYWIARSEALTEVLLTHGSESQLLYCPPILPDYFEKVDVQISTFMPINSKFLSQIDPKRVALSQQARKHLMARSMQREAEGKYRWCGTAYPTLGSAQDAGMSLSQYEDFVFRACYLHLDDPAAKWREIRDVQQRVVDYLNTKKMVRFRVPGGRGLAGDHDGTDLTVSVDGSTWINCDGDSNFPDGEVFAGPKGVDGHVNYTMPAVYNGHEVHGVRLQFKGGRVVEASARSGEEFLIQMLDQDEGARTMGEIAIGTNYEIKQHTKNALFDEKIGGTFHAAVGAGYPLSGNTNQSGLHWDMICEMRPHAGKGWAGGTIEADGELFHKDGKFLRAGWPGNV